MKHINIILIIALTFCLNTCKNKRADFFPNDLDKKWTYSISIHSSYKDEKFLKRIMITNVKRVSKGKKIDLSKLYSDGSYYTYEIDQEKKTVIRKSVLLAFEEGIVEPVEKIVYPDFSFKQKKWEVQEQLFLVKGFQPPLRNFKPRSKFNMSYKVIRENFDFRIKKKSFKNCIEIHGEGEASFIADTRSGPIIVDIRNEEILCDDIGLVYQKRGEITNASAFGNMELEKYLINFGD